MDQRAPDFSANIATQRDLSLLATLTSAALVWLQMAGRFADDYSSQTIQRLSWLSLFYAAVAILIARIVVRYGIQRLLHDRYPVLVVLAILSLAASVIVSTTICSPLVAAAPLFMIVIFHILPKLEVRADLRPAAVILFLAAALPVLLPVLVANTASIIFAPDQTFRGFFQSRTEYGLVAGLAILMLLSWRVSPLTILCCAPLLLGLLRSESRAALLALAIAAGFFAASAAFQFNLRRMMLLAAATALVAVAVVMIVMIGGMNLPGRGIGFLQDAGLRSNILAATLRKLPDVWLFGAGAFYQTVDAGRSVEPHNAIFQSILNFGAIATLLWLMNIARLFRIAETGGRSLIIFWFLFGLFQPGFDAFSFLPESLLVFLAAVSLKGPRDVSQNAATRLSDVTPIGAA